MNVLACSGSECGGAYRDMLTHCHLDSEAVHQTSADRVRHCVCGGHWTPSGHTTL